MGWYKTLKELKKLNERMKKDKKLENYFNGWFEDVYKLKDENEILAEMKSNPDLIKDMVNHWNDIKHKW